MFPTFPGPFSGQLFTFNTNKVSVYNNLFTGIAFGEGQETCCYSSILTHCTLHMITGAYIIVYVVSVSAVL
jgi:hypothetical protein